MGIGDDRITWKRLYADEVHREQTRAALRPPAAVADREARSAMTEAVVEVIHAADRQRALASLTRAFSSDPVMRWGWPDPLRYTTYWPQIADAFGGRAFDHGTAHGLEDCVAVALWLPPRVETDGETVMGLMRESMDDQTFEAINDVFEQMDEHHPTAAHWYLPLTGVDPTTQGRRLGSTLLQQALAICDSDGLPVYLEATSPRSRKPLRAPRIQRRRSHRGRVVATAVAMLREPAS